MKQFEVSGWQGVEATVEAETEEEAIRKHREAVVDRLCERHESFLDVARIMKGVRYTARQIETEQS